MNVLFISNDPQIFDATSAPYQRMQQYRAAIGTLHILMRSSKGVIETEDQGLFVHGLPVGKLDAGKMVQKAKEIIASEHIQVVSAQDPFEHGWIAMKAVEGTSAKLHIQIHTDFLSPWFVRGGILRSPLVSPPVKNRVRQTLASVVLPKAHGIRVVSERIKESIVKKYGTKIVEPVVIPIAVSSTIPDKVPLPPLQFPFVLMTAGRLEPEKRIEDIIEALARIHEKYPAVGLVIVGEGSERPVLEKMVKEKKLTDRVQFLGWRTDVWGLMRSANCYIQASAYEGYGVTLIQAALARVPIVSTDVGVIGEVLRGYDDALVTPPGDPTNLGYHIIAVLEDVQSKEVMVRNAETKALAHVKQYENLPARIAGDLLRLAGGSTPV